MKTKLLFGIVLALGTASVFAQLPGMAGKPGSKETPPSAAKPLPELKGLVSWKTLAQVDLVKQKDRFVPQFSSNVTSLDKKEVKIQGYMMPLEAGEKQTRFILGASPQTCMFCVTGGPEQFVEVRMAKPIKFTFEPIVVGGRLAVLANDSEGVYYRLTDAVAH
jgi:hypothetical protein